MSHNKKAGTVWWVFKDSYSPLAIQIKQVI